MTGHVRTGGIETDDRHRKRFLDLARKLTPRRSVRQRLRPSKLEQTDRRDNTGADADEQRQDMNVQNDVVRVHVLLSFDR